VTAPRDLPRDIGGFIRDLRRNAQISLRQLAEQAGVSNPYLSQIERGLRKPSAEVLAQLAHALRVSTPMMYLRAGLLDSRDGPGVLAAIAADPDLNIAQKQSLTQIYETFRRENARTAPGGEETTPIPIPIAEPARRAVAKAADTAVRATGTLTRAAGSAAKAAAAATKNVTADAETKSALQPEKTPAGQAEAKPAGQAEAKPAGRPDAKPAGQAETKPATRKPRAKRQPDRPTA